MICLQKMSGVQVNTLSYDLGKETLQAPWVHTETIRNGAETGQKYGPVAEKCRENGQLVKWEG
jgi:hypothetical protein